MWRPRRYVDDYGIGPREVCGSLAGWTSGHSPERRRQRPRQECWNVPSTFTLRGSRSSPSGGNDPGPHNYGWKDTVSLDNGDYAELLVKFDGFKEYVSTATTWNTKT